MSALPSLAAALAEAARDIDRMLDRLVPVPPADMVEAQLYLAMRHGLLAGGKRMRPFLVLQTARLFGVADESALRAAAAIECIHAYSLIHDDLPAMDDADTRRGQPSVHKAFDEATAILAGDALLTLAFDVLADPQTHEDAHVRIQLVQELARAAGMTGMVGGQMLDLIGETQRFDAAQVTRLQRLKTGALIAAACQLGALLGRADPAHRQALQLYAIDLGMAFQIADDLLDHEGDQALLGKPVGADAEAGKATFVAVLGVERARTQARKLAEQAAGHLALFEGRAAPLAALAHYTVTRDR